MTPNPISPSRRHRRRSHVRAALAATLIGSVLAVGASAAAQSSNSTCADLGLSPLTPTAVLWDAPFDPAQDPSYQWAYGDVDLLIDGQTDAYWFHWYDAVPGPDAHVRFDFAPGTTVEGVQFINDWSDASLRITGDGTVAEVPLREPFIPHAADLPSLTAGSIQLTTTTQQAKLLEITFCGPANDPDPGGDDDPSDDDQDDNDPEPGECGPAHDPADAYCGSVNVVDSFGDAAVPDDSGAQWNNVRSYYQRYGDRPGMCSIGVHNRYWTAVRSSDGALQYYPSWHPPVHDQGGPNECRFTHEHGMDPRTSDLYDEDLPTNVGVPFGFVHSGAHAGTSRTEDHVGHKVVVANNFQLTTNNPYSEGATLNIFNKLGHGPVTCDWYSKLHQGTHSADALGFNLHEYFLNYSCDDDTRIRVKEMTDFGFRTPAQADGPAGSGGTGTVASDCGWFATNLPAPASDPDPAGDSDFGDAKRGFTCLVADGKIEELWKPSAFVSAPGGAATAAYDPYYVVMNSSRYALYRWWDYLESDGDHVGDDAMISMVDFCVEARNYEAN